MRAEYIASKGRVGKVSAISIASSGRIGRIILLILEYPSLTLVMVVPMRQEAEIFAGEFLVKIVEEKAMVDVFTEEFYVEVIDG